MYTIAAVLEGVAPLLCNGWSQDALDKLDRGETGGKLTPEERHDEACQKVVWTDGDGLPAAPTIPLDGPVTLSFVRPPQGAVKKAIVRACQLANLKEGQKGLGTYLEATLFVDADAAFEPCQVFMHRVWGRRPPRTGPACVVRRPALAAGWRLPLTLVVTDDLRGPDRVRQAVEAAGLLVGIGSWRPEYGRFILAGWHVAGHP
jgi:hypothetical protein